jgi:hypothetical protein
MFIALYRWKIKPGKEQQFIEAWSEVTAYYREKWDSLGSRLHRGDDGIFYAYAQWKSVEQRRQAFAGKINLKAGEKMRDAVNRSFPEVILENLSDFLILPEKF